MLWWWRVRRLARAGIPKLGTGLVSRLPLNGLTLQRMVTFFPHITSPAINKRCNVYNLQEKELSLGLHTDTSW